MVTWERYTSHSFEVPTRFWCSAWASCVHIDCVENEDYSRVPRVHLDADRRWWPPPPGPQLGHYGLLEPDSALDPPAGYRWCNPRNSKR